MASAADEYFRANEPRHASMLRTSASPNIFNAGYRVNVIPSEATATLDVRMLPDEDPKAFLEQVKKVINDPSIEVAFAQRDARPGGTTRLEHRSVRGARSERDASTTRRSRCRR